MSSWSHRTDNSNFPERSVSLVPVFTWWLLHHHEVLGCDEKRTRIGSDCVTCNLSLFPFSCSEQESCTVIQNSCKKKTTVYLLVCLNVKKKKKKPGQGMGGFWLRSCCWILSSCHFSPSRLSSSEITAMQMSACCLHFVSIVRRLSSTGTNSMTTTYSV